MKTINLQVQAQIKAPLSDVWDCYTQPKHITKWNFASDDWHCPSASNDLRTGGKYSARMEAKDGSWGFDFEATYDEVSPLQKLIYTISDGRKASVHFEEQGPQTEISVQFEAESQNSPEMQKDGWQAILNSFKNYVEQQNQ